LPTPKSRLQAAHRLERRDRLKAVHDKDINALLFNHTPYIRWRSLSERESFDVIDPLPYIGADTVIARDMDDIITFASPRNQTAQISVVRPDRSVTTGAQQK
jgi:hypothetical protein